MKTEYTLIDNTAEQRYEIDAEGHTAYIDYTFRGGAIVLTHTLVPKALEGRGIGSALVHLVLEEIKKKGLRIIPECEFISVYIRRHPEWEQLLLTR